MYLHVQIDIEIIDKIIAKVRFSNKKQTKFEAFAKK